MSYNVILSMQFDPLKGGLILKPTKKLIKWFSDD